MSLLIGILIPFLWMVRWIWTTFANILMTGYERLKEIKVGRIQERVEVRRQTRKVGIGCGGEKDHRQQGRPRRGVLFQERQTRAYGIQEHKWFVYRL